MSLSKEERTTLFIRRLCNKFDLKFVEVADLVYEDKLPFFNGVQFFDKIEPWYDIICSYFGVSAPTVSERIRKKYKGDEIVGDLLD